VVQGVKVGRATARTTLTPWAAAARLNPGRCMRDGSSRTPPTTLARSLAGPGPPFALISVSGTGLGLWTGVHYAVVLPMAALVLFDVKVRR
jgi:hypothetical protein